MNPGLIKNFVAETEVPKRRIVKFGTGDGKVALATASTDALVGVASEITSAAGARCDVVLTDIVEVELGGAVTRGDWLTTDANGKAVAAAPGAGVNASVIGRAHATGVAGDVIPALLSPCRIQG